MTNYNNSLHIHGGQNFFLGQYFADLLILPLETITTNDKENKDTKETNNIDIIHENSCIKNMTVFPIDSDSTTLERNFHSLFIDKHHNVFYIFVV